MKFFRFFLPALILPALLFFGCKSPPDTKAVLAPPYKRNLIRSDYLVLALRAADRITDATRNLSLYDRILEIAITAKQTGDASVLLAYTSEILEQHSKEEWFEEYSTALTRRYLNLGKAQEAARLLNAKLLRITNLGNTLRKRLLFEEIIDICLLGGEAFLPLLRQTIDAALVLDDPLIKTEILVESARRFLTRGFIRDTQDLLQLTLSQIGSLESPWDQAEIYSRIALVYKGLKNERRAQDYAGRAVNEIDAVQVITRTEGDAAKVGLTAENLLRLSAAENAFRVAATIEYPWILAETFCRMAILTGNDNLLDRAYETASSITSSARRVSTLFQLDFLLVEAGKVEEIKDNLPLRDIELSLLPALAVDSFTSRLARLYLAAGDTRSAVDTAGRIKDIYNRVSLFIAIARNNLEKGNTQGGFALLEESFDLAQFAGQSRDRILQDISNAYLTGGDTRRAILTAAEISDPYSFALALTDLVRYFLEAGESLDAGSLEILENTLGD
jgi:hypothetical protein